MANHLHRVRRYQKDQEPPLSSDGLDLIVRVLRDPQRCPRCAQKHSEIEDSECLGNLFPETIFV